MCVCAGSGGAIYFFLSVANTITYRFIIYRIASLALGKSVSNFGHCALIGCLAFGAVAVTRIHIFS